MDEHECLIHVDFKGSKDNLLVFLSPLLGSPSIENWSIESDILSIWVLTNDDNFFDEEHDPLDSIFLTYDYILDIGASSPKISQDDCVKDISKLLEAFWNNGIPAVAVCDYHELLPYNGEGMKHQLLRR